MTIVAGLLCQLALAGVWGVRLDSRVRNLEHRLEGYQELTVQVERLEERFDNRMDAVCEKLSLIQSLVQRGGR